MLFEIWMVSICLERELSLNGQKEDADLQIAINVFVVREKVIGHETVPTLLLVAIVLHPRGAVEEEEEAAAEEAAEEEEEDFPVRPDVATDPALDPILQEEDPLEDMIVDAIPVHPSEEALFDLAANPREGLLLDHQEDHPLLLVHL